MVLALSYLSHILASVILHNSPDIRPSPFPSAEVEDVNIVSNFAEGGLTRMEVVLRLPSDCYEAKKVSIRFDDERETLLFFPEIREKKECSGKTAQSSHWVDLGNLDEGSYQIRELISLKRWAKFKIAKIDQIPQETIGLYKK